MSTKLHATCDALGNPTGLFLTAGQAHDLDGSDVLLEELNAQALLADKAYDADKRVLDRLEQRDIEAVIPPRACRRTKRGYDAELYRARHLIENFFQKLKQFRAIATRYDKTAQNFLAAVQLASSAILLA